MLLAALSDKTMSDPEPQPVPDAPKLRWYQFSLRTLLGMITACSMLLGLVAWRGEVVSRMPEVFLAIGLVVFAVGTCLRRWAIAAFGLILLAGLAWELKFVAPNCPANTFRGYEGFRVVDRETAKPISGARVRFVSCATSSGTTDADGFVRLACYRSLNTHSSGFGDHGDQERWSWSLEVTAPDYAPLRAELRELKTEPRSYCEIVPMQRLPSN